MTWRDAGDGYEELLDADGRIVAAFGGNPYGMMGQDWFRGWTFDPVTTLATGTMVWAPGTQRATMRAAIEAAAR
jgi:hypothetical protein